MSFASSLELQPAALAMRARSGARVGIRIHVLCALLIVSLAVPEEFSFHVGASRFTPTRALLLLSTPLLLAKCFDPRVGRPRAADFFVICASAWLLIAVSAVADVGNALAHAAPDVLDFAVAYFAFRLLTNTREQVLASLDIFCLVISITALVSVLDTISGFFFFHDVSASITGYVRYRQHDHRLGLLRAEGPFEHPIHLGAFCSASITIAVSGLVHRRRSHLAAGAIGLLCAISTAPIQACVMGLGVLGYGRLLSRYKHKWWLLTWAFIALVGIAVVISGSPLNFIANNLTFDPESAWSRVYEWQMASAVIEQSPWFGIAPFNWAAIAKEIGTFESMDSLWLALAVGYGKPGSALIAAALISAAWARTRGPDQTVIAEGNPLRELLSIMLYLTVYFGFTVHYWAALWVFAGVLTGLRASRGCAG